ncbi:hypothetical protein ERO13_D11G224401v2 [Gossypium hirsutum]|uniref:Uncharacterized protein n=1 Tax=Gossypium darwinii TaxID=34276 RepID=A0A5D2APQ3_GOSDA|nr:hypothetical protein ERO13_D11G224401v2 [Gossypium hirsutum]TYG46400.1 hypothetical protein ES288_D11G253600v1 [Gossypium darwinii]
MFTNFGLIKLHLMQMASLATSGLGYTNRGIKPS